MNRIYLSPPHLGGEELKYVEQAFKENWIAPVGPNIDEFEKELSSYFDGAGCLVVSSGTAAIHLALEVLNVGSGDDVICSTFTFAGSCFPILYRNANPIFVESEPDTWNMDAVFLEKAIKQGIERGRKPKAIILVHLYGMPARDLSEILLLAKEFEIPVIEDSAEAAGSTKNKKKLGTFGDIGILSFNGNKIITTSGGGALLSRNQAFVNHSKYLSTQARSNELYYQHEAIGYNYRMSNVLAGIGIGQIKLLNERVLRRRIVFDKYKEALDKFICTYQIETPDSYSNRWLSCFVFDDDSIKDRLIDELQQHNIESRPLWKPMHLQPVFRGCEYYGDRCSEELFAKGICLPSGSLMTDSELDFVISVILKVLD